VLIQESTPSGHWSSHIHSHRRAPYLGHHRGSFRIDAIIGKLRGDSKTHVCALGRMATLHTISPISFVSLHATLTSQSEMLFLVSLRIPGIPDPIPTVIDSGETSNFIDSTLATMSIFVPAALAQPITLCLFNSKPTTSGFIHHLISTTVHFSDESHQDLNLLVMKLHPLAPIVLSPPWL